jgi:hypothetical protein
MYLVFWYMKVTSEPMELISVEAEHIHTYKFHSEVSLNIVY